MTDGPKSGYVYSCVHQLRRRRRLRAGPLDRRRSGHLGPDEEDLRRRRSRLGLRILRARRRVGARAERQRPAPAALGHLPGRIVGPGLRIRPQPELDRRLHAHGRRSPPSPQRARLADAASAARSACSTHGVPLLRRLRRHGGRDALAHRAPGRTAAPIPQVSRPVPLPLGVDVPVQRSAQSPVRRTARVGRSTASASTSNATPGRARCSPAPRPRPLPRPHQRRSSGTGRSSGCTTTSPRFDFPYIVACYRGAAIGEADGLRARRCPAPRPPPYAQVRDEASRRLEALHQPSHRRRRPRRTRSRAAQPVQAGEPAATASTPASGPARAAAETGRSRFGSASPGRIATAERQPGRRDCRGYRVALNRDGRVTTTGLPACAPGALHGGLAATALPRCRPALVKVAAGFGANLSLSGERPVRHQRQRCSASTAPCAGGPRSPSTSPPRARCRHRSC